jgi:hypothetical protein
MGVREEASSWLLAAELARRLGPRYQLCETHRSDGQYDSLTFAPGGEVLPVIHLNRPGSIHIVGPSEGPHVVVHEDPWSALASGARGVEELADGVLAAAGLPRDAGLMATAPVVTMIAAALRSAALFGVPWTVRSGRLNTSGMVDSDFDGVRHELFAPYLNRRADMALPPSGVPAVPERYWFLCADDEATPQPVACFDQRGTVHPVKGASEEITGVTGAAAAADRLFGPVLARWVTHSGANDRPARPGLGLPAVLAAFNRKERYYLFAAATGGLGETEVHGPSVSLAATFRDAVAAALGENWRPPAHAWAAVDYHLDWLHAALQWWAGATGPGRVDHLPTAPGGPTEAKAVTGTQEDGDLVAAWQDGERTRLLVVEAKAYGAWSNGQAASKLARLRTIYDAARNVAPGLTLRWLLASPTPPGKLDATLWPDWALQDGKPAWMPLPVPALRVATQRCDPGGHPSQTGTEWRITGPTSPS